MNNQLLTIQVLSRSLDIATLTTFSGICYNSDNHNITVYLFIECSCIYSTNRVCICVCIVMHKPRRGAKFKMNTELRYRYSTKEFETTLNYVTDRECVDR